MFQQQKEIPTKKYAKSHGHHHHLQLSLAPQLRSSPPVRSDSQPCLAIRKRHPPTRKHPMIFRYQWPKWIKPASKTWSQQLRDEVLRSPKVGYFSFLFFVELILVSKGWLVCIFLLPVAVSGSSQSNFKTKLCTSFTDFEYFSLLWISNKQITKNHLPSRGLTYPTLGKGKSSSKCHFWGIC